DPTAQVLLELLTPVAKTFPAERGFEANALAVQIHGGYGYSSEYLPEAWLRDQKLNTIHEGTSGIQAIDLVGRRVTHDAMIALGGEIMRACSRARVAGVEEAWIAAVEHAMGVVATTTGAIAKGGDPLRHATDYLDMFATLVIAWHWLELAAIAKEALAGALPRGKHSRDEGFYKAKLAAAQYWILTEVPRIAVWAQLCTSNEDSYAALDPSWL
ncbi:MAG TPA: acyl-CoA dehydrogenase C-terminal domain-containing protein, partial [Kofleriaceae bacterium]